MKSDEIKTIKDVREFLRSHEQDHIDFGKKLDSIVLQLKEPTEMQKQIDNAIFDDKIEAAMKKALLSTSKWSYQALLIAAGVIGALVVIGGGFKFILQWIGFTRT